MKAARGELSQDRRTKVLDPLRHLGMAGRTSIE